MKAPVKIRADGLVTFVNKENYKRKRVSMSELTSIAHNASQCSDKYKFEAFANTVWRVVNDYQNLPLSLRYVIWILYNSGCRISEVLALTRADVSVSNDIKLKALKGGIDRIVRIPMLDNTPIIKLRSSGLIFDDYNRFYIYRICKQRGLYIHKAGREVLSVTHSFRTVYANSILEVSEPDKATANAMGHKSKKTIDWYAQKGKK